MSPHDHDNELESLRRRVSELERENLRLRTATAGVASANANAAMQLVEMNDQRTRELEAKNAEIAAALVEAEQVSDQKSRFLANVSHELRTPISGILGMAELIAAGELGALQRDRIASIVQTAESFLDLVNHLLDFSKAGAGALELGHERFDLWQTCEHVSELLQVQAARKGVEFDFFLGASVPRHVHGDPLRLRQVLLNLGVNAVKFTQRGIVSMSVTAIDGGVGFGFADTGCGFEQKDARRIFEPFVQADASTTRRFGGTGLGLSICRELVACMGGGIDCESEAGHGSTFVVRLPLQDGGSGGSGATATASVRVARVLVARASTMQLLRDHLPTHGVSVLFEDEPGTADILVVEAALDSMGVLRALRTRYPELPVVLVDGTGAVEDACGYEDLGVVSVLSHPIRPSQLTKVLGGGAPARSLMPAAAEPSTTFAATALVADDSPINLSVLSGQLRRCGVRVTEVADGEAAVAAFCETEFDIVFLDCQMPKLDGYGVASQLRGHEQQAGRRRVPIVALTADTDSSNEARCLAAGMDVFCGKPIRRDRLHELLSSLLPHRVGGRSW